MKTETKPAPTPTPWIAEESSIRYEGQRDRLRRILIGTPRNEKGGRFIACEIQGPAQNMDADAAFIVRAVNAHEELLESLKDCYAQLADIIKDERCDHAVNICWCGTDMAIQKAKQAITKAEGNV